MKPPLTIPTCVKEFCRLNRESFLPSASDAKLDDLVVGQTMLVLDLISEKQGRLQRSIARLSSIHKHSKALDNSSFKSLVAYLSEAGLVDASTSDYMIARASDLRGSHLPLSV
jgi:uncharacterized tellurite resistance protein B-like protein